MEQATGALQGIRSKPWSRVALAFCVLELALVGVYAWYFFTAQGGDSGAVIFDLRKYLIPAIPFIALIHFFLLGLWVHALYTDMFLLFGNKNLNPQRAMMLVVIPLVNIYGFGRALARVTVEADKTDKTDQRMRRFNRLNKYGLLVFYASVGVIIFSMYYMVNLDFTAGNFNNDFFRFFNALELLVLASTSIGVLVSIIGAQGVINHKWKWVLHKSLAVTSSEVEK
jgi:hypothetical protein